MRLSKPLAIAAFTLLVALGVTMTAHAHEGFAEPGLIRGGQATPPPIPHLAEWTCIHNGTPVTGGQPGTVGSGEGAWTDDTSNGYYGGLQFDRPFEEAYGADMLAKYGTDAEAWTPRDQMIVANRALAVRGYEPWPLTARACGLI